MVGVREDRGLFLCYSRRDSHDLCVQLYHWLEREGVRAFCDLVDDPGGTLGNVIFDVLRHSSAVLFIASPASVADLRNSASWVSRELSCAADAHRRMIMLRLPGVDPASCEQLQLSNIVVAGATPLSAPTLHSLMSATAVRPLSIDDMSGKLSEDHARRRAEVVDMVRKICQVERSTDIRPLWPLLRSTLTADETLTLSSQGFFTLPLHSRVEGGRIRELIRLHFWPEPATTSSYSSENYRLQHKVSSVVNTGEAVSVEFECSATFNGGQSYTVPAGEFHSTRAAATDLEFAASLFFFDSEKGWVAKAPVVGPAQISGSTQRRETTIAARYFLDRLDLLLS